MEEEEDQRSNDGEIAPNATVYVRNINERVKIPAVIEALREIFAEFGKIEDIIAKKSIRRKGQAFVIFDDIESAQEAVENANGFEIFGKQLQVQFAKARSDITVLNEDGEAALEEFQVQRKQERDRKNAEAQAAAEAAAAAKAAALAAEKSKKREHSDDDDDDPSGHTAKWHKVGAAAHIPDEYVPPGPTLTVRELPSDVSPDDLQAAFSVYARFKEVRKVPGRDLAFVVFEDADAAQVAKESTADLQINGHNIRTTYRRAG